MIRADICALALPTLFGALIVGKADGAESTPPQPTAAASSRSVGEGVYTLPQARRGLPIYLKQCSGCHGESFRGGESSPTLLGADFLARWKGLTLADLFAKIHLMPPNDPGKLSSEQISDVMAAILHANKLPDGQSELTTEEAQLATIRFSTTQ